jgi:hypothetical protein
MIILHKINNTILELFKLINEIKNLKIVNKGQIFLKGDDSIS